MNKLSLYLIVVVSLFFSSEVLSQISFDQDYILEHSKDSVLKVNVNFSVKDTSLNYFLDVKAGTSSIVPTTEFKQFTDSFAVSNKNESKVISIPKNAKDEDIVIIAMSADQTISYDTIRIVVLEKTKYDGLVKFDASNSDVKIQEPDTAKKNLTAMVTALISADFPFEEIFEIKVNWQKTTFPFKLPVSAQKSSVKGKAGGNFYLGYVIEGDSTVIDDRIIYFDLVDSKGKKWDSLEVKVKSYEGSLKVDNYNYYISIGGSADFLNNQNRIKGFFDLNVETPRFGFSKEEKDRNWRIGGYLSSGSSISNLDTLSSEFNFLANADSLVREPGEVALANESATFGRQNSATFISIRLSAGIELLPPKNGHSIVLDLITEFTERRRSSSLTLIDSELSIVNINPDSITVSLDENRAEKLEGFKSRVWYEGILTPGIKYMYDSDDIRCQVGGYIGAPLYDLKMYTQFGDFHSGKYVWMTNFSLIYKKSGFKVGGDIRGKIGESQIEIDGVKFDVPNRPLFTIYLSKTFSFKKLADFITE